MREPTSQMLHKDIIRERIDSGPMSAGIWLVIGLCFLLNMLDGFDVVAMSVTAPTLTQDWGITAGQKGLILSSALLGMTLGAMYLAPLCDRYGRRKLILASSVTTGLSMISTGYCPQSIALLCLLRLITGLGIGVILASTTTITTEFTPEKWRNLTVPIVVAGYPFGAMLVGPVAHSIIPTYGWETLFIFGGAVTLMLSVIMAFLLPESVSYMATQSDRKGEWLARINLTLSRIRRDPIDALPELQNKKNMGSVRSILTPHYRLTTLTLWLGFFCGFLSLYFMLSWIPSLFVSADFSIGQGIAALTYFNIGGVLGILLMGVITTKMRLSKPISVFYGLTVVAILLFVLTRNTSLFSLNAFIFIIGLFLQGAFTGMYSAAARVYKTTERATGIGWAIGLGRTGAFISPAFAGVLVGLGWTIYPLFLLFAVPVFIASILAAGLKT